MSLNLSLENASEIDKNQALKWVNDNTFIDTPPYFMTHWKTKKKFFAARNVLAAFEETSSFLILSGEPLYEKEQNLFGFFEEFKSFAKKKKKRICGYHVNQDFFLNEFKAKPLGTSTIIKTKDYDFESSSAKEVRRSLKKGSKADYKVIENFKSSDENNGKLKSLVKNWRKSKLPFKVQYLLSLPDEKTPIENSELSFAVEKDSELLAFCSLLPYRKNGDICYYIDNLIYEPKKETHALSFLISSLIKKLKADKVPELNLGLNPFAESNKEHSVGYFFELLYKNKKFYSPSGLHYFKSKFGSFEKTEYYFYEKSSNHFRALFNIAKLINR